MTAEMTQSRLNLLKKGLIGPEIDHLRSSIDQKIALCRNELKEEMYKELTKNEFYVKGKLQLLDELIIQIETLERQAKTNFAFGSSVTSNLEVNVSRLSDRMTWLQNSFSPSRKTRNKTTNYLCSIEKQVDGGSTEI